MPFMECALKFRYSEKATEFLKNLPLLLNIFLKDGKEWQRKLDSLYLGSFFSWIYSLQSKKFYYSFNETILQAQYKSSSKGTFINDVPY